MWYLYIFWADDTSSHYPNYDDIHKAIRSQEEAVALAHIIIRDYDVTRVHVYEHKPTHRLVLKDRKDVIERVARATSPVAVSSLEDPGDEPEDYGDDQGD